MSNEILKSRSIGRRDESGVTVVTLWNVMGGGIHLLCGLLQDLLLSEFAQALVGSLLA